MLEAKTYRLSIPGADEDEGLTGDLDIAQGSLTIASTSGYAVIDATGLEDRVLHVLSGARVCLKNLIIMGGNSRVGVDGLSQGSKAGNG